MSYLQNHDIDVAPRLYDSLQPELLYKPHHQRFIQDYKKKYILLLAFKLHYRQIQSNRVVLFCQCAILYM